MPILKKINVIFLYVVDLEGVRQFYEDTLQLGPPVLETPEWIEYRLEEGSNFALKKTEPECLDGYDPALNNVRFSFVVDDLRALYEELTAKGVRFVRAPEVGYGFILAELEDPEGNPLRLLQYTTDHAAG